MRRALVLLLPPACWLGCAVYTAPALRDDEPRAGTAGALATAGGQQQGGARGSGGRSSMGSGGVPSAAGALELPSGGPSEAGGASEAGEAGSAGAPGGTSCEVELLAAADTYIIADAPGGNNGTASMLAITRSGATGSSRVLLRFDLSQLPPGALPVSAALELTIQSATPEKKNVDAHRIVAGGSWTETGVSWLEMTLGDGWLISGGDFAPASSPGVVPSTSNPGVVVRWDVTADVLAYLEAPEENAGWLLKDRAEPAEGGGEVVRFHSRETNLPPRLVLTICE